jgi:hypothetical protein
MARPLPRLALVAGIAAGLVAGGLTTAIAINGDTIDPPPRIAFVARSDNPADALAAGPVAGQLGAPLFVTPTGTLVDAAKAGLIAYAPELVIITGGFAAISAETEAAIETALGLADDKVVRAQGKDRHETAVAIVNLLAAYNPAYLPVDAKAADADLLDGLDAMKIPGTAGIDFATIEAEGVNFEQPAAVELAKVDIVAPTAGWVVVHFDGHAYADTGDILILAASDVPDDWAANSGNVSVNGSGSVYESSSFSHSRVYEVAAGAHSFYAVGQNYVQTAGNGIGSVYGQLTVQFFPNRL